MSMEMWMAVAEEKPENGFPMPTIFQALESLIDEALPWIAFYLANRYLRNNLIRSNMFDGLSNDIYSILELIYFLM